VTPEDGEAPLLIGRFPHVVVPPGNPMTPERILLGKALFFEEQISSDDTVACATCHLPDAGGGDPRAAATVKAPGADGRMNTPDDEFGSFGVVAQNASGNFEHSPIFGVARQVTGRSSPSVIGAAFFNTQFWDSRAKPVFRDLDGNVVLPAFASLESQAVEPPLSSVEMSHAQRDWHEITAKLARVRPLALASDLPAALDEFIGAETSYTPLFARVFGDGAITRERVAMAIATYERTLVPDQTPFDLGTMTSEQQRGLDIFVRERCDTCHPVSNGLFSDGKLQTIHLPNHERAVKTPTLRNAGLKKRFMSSGQIATMALVLQHYQQLGQFDPAPGEVGAMRTFLEDALTDPRVAARLPPFDRPRLASERLRPGTNQFGVATRGTDRITPLILADTPAFLGNPDFKIGLGAAYGGTRALLACSPRKADPGATFLGVPLAVDLPFLLYKPFIVPRTLPGRGVVTFRTTLPTSTSMLGQEFFAQWFVQDPGAAGGISATRGAAFRIFGR
jgi:cytochrome c peroxidase